MTETFAALVGVVVGVILGEVTSWWRRRSESRQKAKAVRLLLHLEIEQNLVGLTEAIHRINTESENKRAPAELVLPSFLARMSMPVWSQLVWHSQLTNVAEALNIFELQQAYDFYSALDRIDEIVQTMAANRNQVTYQMELYNRCLDLMEELIRKGSPLGASWEDQKKPRELKY